MKIIKIEERPWYARIFTIEYWNVWVESDGEVKKYHCWASTTEPNVESLLWSLKNKLYFSENMKDLIGKEL